MGEQGAGKSERERMRDDVWMQVQSAKDVESDRDETRSRETQRSRERLKREKRRALRGQQLSAADVSSVPPSGQHRRPRQADT